MVKVALFTSRCNLGKIHTYFGWSSMWYECRSKLPITEWLSAWITARHRRQWVYVGPAQGGSQDFKNACTEQQLWNFCPSRFRNLSISNPTSFSSLALHLLSCKLFVFLPADYRKVDRPGLINSLIKQPFFEWIMSHNIAKIIGRIFFLKIKATFKWNVRQLNLQSSCFL